MKFIFAVSLISLILNFTNGSYDETSAEREYNLHVYRKYMGMDYQIKEIADKTVKMLLPYLMEAKESMNISATCATNLFKLLSGIRNLKEWAVRFLDATGKLQTGIMHGNIHMLGEYDECMDITVKRKDRSTDFQGQYCSILSRPILPIVKKRPSVYERLEGLVDAARNASEIMKFLAANLHLGYYIKGLRIGLCIPSGCNERDITEMVNYVFEIISMNATVDYCLKKDDIIFWTTPIILSTGILVLLAIMTVSATMFEYIKDTWKTESSSVAVRILLCFSLPRNLSKLCSLKSQEKTLQCLHGIRTITMLWVVILHEYLFMGELETINHLLRAKDTIPRFFAQIIWNGALAMQTFFFLSGFLNSYIRITLMKDNKTAPSIIKIIISRLWRIYPTLIVAHCMFFLLNKPGPSNYGILQRKSENCERNWWMNFLFVNNLIKYENMCLVPTWFLSADMQLFLLSLFTVPLLRRNPKTGIFVNICLIFIGSLWSIIWSWVKHLSPAIIDITRMTFSDINNFGIVYFYPIPYFGPYFIGILWGYFVSTKKDMKISKFKQAIGWFFATFSFLSVMFITKMWNSGKPYSRLESSLYSGFSRTFYALAIAWVVLCCANGYGGFVNTILSLRIWCPISRLTYMMYLTSFILQMFFQSNLSLPYDFSNMTIAWSYFGSLSISILLSLVLVVIAESPFLAMGNLIFRRREEKDKPPSGAPNQMTLNDMSGNGLKTMKNIHIRISDTN